MKVSANVGGSSFNEVTFYARVQGGAWRPIGTDDTRPYRVFHDVSAVPDGQRVAYRAVVRDNAGHTRVSARERAIVPKPTLTIKSPAEGANVFGKIAVGASPTRSAPPRPSASSADSAAVPGRRSRGTAPHRRTSTTTTCPAFRWAR